MGVLGCPSEHWTQQQRAKFHSDRNVHSYSLAIFPLILRASIYGHEPCMGGRFPTTQGRRQWYRYSAWKASLHLISEPTNAIVYSGLWHGPAYFPFVKANMFYGWKPGSPKSPVETRFYWRWYVESISSLALYQHQLFCVRDTETIQYFSAIDSDGLRQTPDSASLWNCPDLLSHNAFLGSQFVPQKSVEHERNKTLRVWTSQDCHGEFLGENCVRAVAALNCSWSQAAKIYFNWSKLYPATLWRWHHSAVLILFPHSQLKLACFTFSGCFHRIKISGPPAEVVENGIIRF